MAQSICLWCLPWCITWFLQDPWSSPWSTMKHGMVYSLFIPWCLTMLVLTFRSWANLQKNLFAMEYYMVTHGALNGKRYGIPLGWPRGASTKAHSVKQPRLWGMPWYVFLVAFMVHLMDGRIYGSMDTSAGVSMAVSWHVSRDRDGRSPRNTPMGNAMTAWHTP